MSRIIVDSIRNSSASSDGITLASNGSVNIPTLTTNSSFGKILQVVSTTKTDGFTSSSTSYTDVTGLSATITPSSSSSKVYVMVHVSSSSNTRYAAFRLVKGTTPIAVGTVTGNQDAATFTIGSNPDNTSDSFVLRNQSAAILDTPSTTSATTYKLQGRITYGSGNFYVNRKVYTDTTSSYVVLTSITITLYEVSA